MTASAAWRICWEHSLVATFGAVDIASAAHRTAPMR